MKQTNIKTTLISNNTTKTHKNRIKDWTKYNNCLVSRGNFSTLIQAATLQSVQQSGKPGHPTEYSDALILVLVQLREFTQLPFRQLIGLAHELAGFLGVKLPAYSTLCKRMKKLSIALKINSRQIPQGFFFLVDSTGLKLHGEGEWYRHKHGPQKRRGWKKVHIGIDYTSEQIVALKTTTENVADASVLPDLVDIISPDLSVRQIIGDGAYGTHKLYAEIEGERGLSLLSPPHKNAKWHGDIKDGVLVDEKGWETHNKYVRGCMRLGPDEWKNQIGYHKRSLVENTMFRLKSAFSGKLKSKTKANQEVEIITRVNLLNMWTAQSLPQYT